MEAILCPQPIRPLAMPPINFASAAGNRWGRAKCNAATAVFRMCHSRPRLHLPVPPGLILCHNLLPRQANLLHPSNGGSRQRNSHRQALPKASLRLNCPLALPILCLQRVRNLRPCREDHSPHSRLRLHHSPSTAHHRLEISSQAREIVMHSRPQARDRLHHSPWLRRLPLADFSKVLSLRRSHSHRNRQ